MEHNIEVTHGEEEHPEADSKSSETDQDDAFVELDAMKTMARALSPLDEAARTRVIRWAADRFAERNVQSPHTGSTAPNRREDAPAPQGAEFAEMADLFSVAAPRTDAERVLVVAYWHQVHEEQADIDSYSVNRDLKNLGHGVSNVTRAFSALIGQRPQPVVQTRKGGTSKQARKRYRLTTVGISRVEEMLGQESVSN